MSDVKFSNHRSAHGPHEAEQEALYSAKVFLPPSLLNILPAAVLRGF